MFDKNIPIPKKGKSIGLVGTLRLMEVGDSFEIEKHQRNTLSAAAAQAKIKVISRSQENGMVRVWRSS